MNWEKLKQGCPWRMVGGDRVMVRCGASPVLFNMKAFPDDESRWVDACLEANCAPYHFAKAMQHTPKLGPANVRDMVFGPGSEG